MANKRFETIYSQGTVDVYKVIVDMETGVNYLCATNWMGIGLTVMLDSEGEPIITSSEIRSEMKQRTWWERIFN